MKIEVGQHTFTMNKGSAAEYQLATKVEDDAFGPHIILQDTFNLMYVSFDIREIKELHDWCRNVLATYHNKPRPKSYGGIIRNWRKIRLTSDQIPAEYKDNNKGFVIQGECLEHPTLMGRCIQTSLVIRQEGHVIETMNSIYELGEQTLSLRERFEVPKGPHPEIPIPTNFSMSERRLFIHKHLGKLPRDWKTMTVIPATDKPEGG